MRGVEWAMHEWRREKALPPSPLPLEELLGRDGANIKEARHMHTTSSAS
jgi:hypothetical protein